MADLRMGEAMARLKVCRKTLRKYCREGQVLAYQLPGERGDWRIDEDSLEIIRGNVTKRALAHLKKLGL